MDAEEPEHADLTVIPVGPLTVPVPIELRDVVAKSGPVELTVPRVWIGCRGGTLEVHFGPVEVSTLQSADVSGTPVICSNHNH